MAWPEETEKLLIAGYNTGETEAQVRLMSSLKEERKTTPYAQGARSLGDKIRNTRDVAPWWEDIEEDSNCTKKQTNTQIHIEREGKSKTHYKHKKKNIELNGETHHTYDTHVLKLWLYQIVHKYH